MHYGPIAGTVELRKALSRHCTRYGLEYAPEEILVSTGVVHGVFLSMLAYLDPGDEILVPDPGYLIYFADPHIAQAKPVSYPLREENGFQLDAETLEALITPRTKAILICSPANPCGSVLDQASLDTVAELAIRHNLLVLSDEIYADMTYDRPMPPSIASRSRMIMLRMPCLCSSTAAARPAGPPPIITTSFSSIAQFSSFRILPVSTHEP